MTLIPDVLQLTKRLPAEPALSPAELEAALFEKLAWQHFTASWQRQSEYNRQLLLGLETQAKSRFAHNLLLTQQVSELRALQAQFAPQRQDLAAAAWRRCQQHGARTTFLTRLGR